MVSTDHFRQEIRSRLELATTRGDHDITIDSGELYKSLSKLPAFGNNRAKTLKLCTHSRPPLFEFS